MLSEEELAYTELMTNHLLEFGEDEVKCTQLFDAIIKATLRKHKIDDATPLSSPDDSRWVDVAEPSNARKKILTTALTNALREFFSRDLFADRPVMDGPQAWRFEPYPDPDSKVDKDKTSTRILEHGADLAETYGVVASRTEGRAFMQELHKEYQHAVVVGIDAYLAEAKRSQGAQVGG